MNQKEGTKKKRNDVRKGLLFQVGGRATLKHKGGQESWGGQLSSMGHRMTRRTEGGLPK